MAAKFPLRREYCALTPCYRSHLWSQTLWACERDPFKSDQQIGKNLDHNENTTRPRMGYWKA